MKRNAFTLPARDRTELYMQTWTAEEPPKAIVQIAHGMAEHIGRYDAFAQFLVKHHIFVYGNDHRGHGRTMKTEADKGYFADRNGFEIVMEDLRAVTERIEQDYPGTPIMLFGHSMGSFLARRYVQLYGRKLRGLILSGTGDNPRLLLKAGKAVARIEGRLRGKRARSRLLTDMSFGQFNRTFQPNRTEYDWLSRDHQAVDAYIADPLCGGVFTAQFFYDLFTGSELIICAQNIAKVPKELPIFLVSGNQDPVGDQTKGVLHAHQAFVDAGIRDISYVLYRDGRHEMLHEVNKEEVYGDILRWVQERL